MSAIDTPPLLPDPRIFPVDAGSLEPIHSRGPDWQGWARESLASASRQHSDELDTRLERSMCDAFRNGRASDITAALHAAPSAALYRHLCRGAIAAWRSRPRDSDAAVLAHGFAIPVVVVAACDAAIELPARLSDPDAIIASMRHHGALQGNTNFGVADVLAGGSAVGLEAAARWPSPEAIEETARWIDALAPAPIAVLAGREGAHLRFIAGSALAAPGAALFEAKATGGLSVAESLSRQLASGGAQVLALPGAATDILSAWQQGLVAHREVALQLFASSAIRGLRANFGEPAAVVSAHHAEAGELRISLSSPFGERDAEGFRCPLYPFERIDDVLKSVIDLLEACRIADVQVLPGIHPDRDRALGLPLFFRADTVRTGGPGSSALR